MPSTKKNYTTIDEYISNIPKNIQIILNKLPHVISEAAPEAEEAISYGIPTFKLKGNLVLFAGYKNHIGFYPTPSGIEAFKDELASYELSKGTIKFPIDKPISFNLVKKIVGFRVKKNLNKK